ncbi:MAG: ATP-dependent DNA ligase [Nitriliruptorales bacterium]|nr:ATP-dependent DNA ligase [Nitriliruptorales bacterium]
MKLSSPDKILWPQTGLTKRDLLAYYEAVAERMLPHLRDRPLTLLRANAGIDRERFLQKNLPASAPESLRRFDVWTQTSNRTVAYALADDIDDLRYFANQNAVELHPWFSRVDMPDRADAVAFDLDPSDERVSVWWAALKMRETLEDLGLESLVKTSGKRGIHVYVPVQRRYDFSALRAFGLAASRLCASRYPDELTVEMRKEHRRGRLLLDWSRAGRAQTLAAPWSPRAHPAGTVSTPLAWEEIDGDLDPTTLTLRTAPQRPDHWAQMPAPQRIEQACKVLEEQGIALEDASPRSSRPLN